MPWEKAFDEELAVDRAMQVFWEKGYEPSSLADLIKATGINRGSFYNAFGGKQQLFLRALEKYEQENRRNVLAELEALNNPIEAIEGLFQGIIEEAQTDDARKGCFLINTALDIAHHETDVADLVEKGIRETEAFFRRCIEVGQARSEIPAGIEPEETAKALMSLLVAIRVLGRGIYSENELVSIAKQATRLIS